MAGTSSRDSQRSRDANGDTEVSNSCKFWYLGVQVVERDSIVSIERDANVRERCLSGSVGRMAECHCNDGMLFLETTHKLETETPEPRFYLYLNLFSY